MDHLTLSLETATRGGSLALLRGDTLLTSSTGIADESHSVNLLSQIETLLHDARVTLRDVDLFAVASGPGSFTGLRIGLATMKAFAVVFERPCVGVPTLDAIIYAAGEFECTFALLPAGRGEVFALASLGARASRPLLDGDRTYQPGGEFVESSERLTALVSAGGTPAVPRGPIHVPPRVLLDRITEANSIRWAGPGAHLYKEMIRERAAALGVMFVEKPADASDEATQWVLAPNIDQLAEIVGRLAIQRVASGETHHAEDLHAIYVRPSDAELNK